jgi:GNAT superfamily N-acetyltransferase
MSETITFLEMTDLADLREPSRPARVAYEVRKAHDPAINRSLYEEIGSPHNWIDRLRWNEAQWAAWEAGVETWVAEVDGETAGYFELRVDRDSTLISIFGIREAYRGRGLGSALLTEAIKRGFELAPRVWVSTNTMDAEHALANYEARGMRPFRREQLQGS